jgi:hypothetical protein
VSGALGVTLDRIVLPFRTLRPLNCKAAANQTFAEIRLAPAAEQVATAGRIDPARSGHMRPAAA